MIGHVVSRGAERAEPAAVQPAPDRTDAQDKYAYDLPHHFALLPYREVFFHGARANLQDLPLATHLHGWFHLGARGWFTVRLAGSEYEQGVKNEPNERSPDSPWCRAIRLEDDFTRDAARHMVLEILEIDQRKRTLTAERREAGPDERVATPAAADATLFRGPAFGPAARSASSRAAGRGSKPCARNACISSTCVPSFSTTTAYSGRRRRFPADSRSLSPMDRSADSSAVSRRRLLAGATLSAASAASAVWARAAEPRPRRILLRSSWQTINIGDVAHTPGILHLLERHLPNAEVWLCPSRVDGGVSEMLAARFPRVRILDRDRDLAEAFAECDFLLHGSGPFLVAAKDVRAWRETTGKPYGVYGITLDPAFLPDSRQPAALIGQSLADSIDLLSTAAFAFFRDSASLAVARKHGCTCATMQFATDAAFATDLRDDAAAERFLTEHGLQAGRFLCCIPRYRHTPYWRLLGSGQEVDPVRHARNEALKEHDHAPLRAAIERVVREAEMRVLICPEDRTQMDIGLGDWLFDLDDEADAARIAPTVFEIATRREAAREKVAAARRVVENRQHDTMKTLAAII